MFYWWNVTGMCVSQHSVLRPMYVYETVMLLACGLGSSVEIATNYGLDGPGIEYSLCRALNQGGPNCSYKRFGWEVEAIA
jgi:hypothetical protein